MPDEIRMQSSGTTTDSRDKEDQLLRSHQPQHRPSLSQTHPSPGSPPAAIQYPATSPASHKSPSGMGEERIDVMERSGMVDGQPLPRMGASFVPRRRNFVQRNCGICISLIKWLPVLFIVSVLCWGYYAYAIQLCFFNLQNVILRVIFLVVFHYLMLMTLWSYYQTVFTEPGKVPRNFWLTNEDMDALNSAPSEPERQAIFNHIVSERNIPIATRTYSGSFRVCEKCNLIKPDRAHHCSVCDCCVLKMDHHCPWVNNCVSFTNYKFFVLFLGYAFILCLFAAATSFPHFLRFWKHDTGSGMGKLHIMFLFFVSIMFAVSLASLFFYHIFLTLKNRSTLESFRTPIFRYGPDRKAYDLGKRENWQEIFGDSAPTWFLPISSGHGSGLVFKLRIDRFLGPSTAEEGRHPLLQSVDDDDDGEQMVPMGRNRKDQV